jgi:formate dehydrogenase major subunit
LGIRDQQLTWVASRRGKVISRAMVSERINKGAVYMTYQWWIGACNELTLDEVDPIAKTPEYKHCAVKLEPIADQNWAENYVRQEYSALKARLRKEAEVAG